MIQVKDEIVQAYADKIREASSIYEDVNLKEVIGSNTKECRQINEISEGLENLFHRYYVVITNDSAKIKDISDNFEEVDKQLSKVQIG